MEIFYEHCCGLDVHKKNITACMLSGSKKEIVTFGIAARRGENKAKIAVAHSILVIVYNVLKKRISYNELGADYFNKLNKQGVVKRATKVLESLGYEVSKTS